MKSNKIVAIIFLSTIIISCSTNIKSTNNHKKNVKLKSGLFTPVLDTDTLEFSNFDKKTFERIYQFEISGYPESIELIKQKDSTFTGAIRSKFYDLKNRKEVLVLIKIQNQLAKKMFKKVTNLKIDKIVSCRLNNDCIEGLDGDDTCLYILDSKNVNKLYFWSLYLDEKKDKNMPENRKQALKIIRRIDEYIDLNSILLISKSVLPKGKYTYWSIPLTSNRFRWLVSYVF